MSTEHAHWLERGDIYALGALDGEELKDFQTHLATECSICKAYIQETRETLNLLHRSLRPMTPSPEVKERVLEHIDSENVVSLTVAKPKESQSLAENYRNDCRGNHRCHARRCLLSFSLRAAAHGL